MLDIVIVLFSSPLCVPRQPSWGSDHFNVQYGTHCDRGIEAVVWKHVLEICDMVWGWLPGGGAPGA